MHRATLCFTCGQPVKNPPTFNQLPDGGPCPACRDRALDAAPPVLPRVARPAPDARMAEARWEEWSPTHPESPYGDYPEPA